MLKHAMSGTVPLPFQTCMEQLIALNKDAKRKRPNWKFFLNLAGTVMPRISVKEMARHGTFTSLTPMTQPTNQYLVENAKEAN